MTALTNSFLPIRHRAMNHPEDCTPGASVARSANFLNDLETLSKDPEKLALLLIEQLRLMPLCPLQGTQVQDFIHEDVTTGCAWTCLRFDRVINVVGFVELPLNTPVTKLLKQAIADNLKSRMFKAARILRKLNRLRVRKQAKWDRDRNAQYRQFSATKLTVGAHPDRAGYQAAWDEFFATRDAYYLPLEERLEQRIHRVHEATQYGDVTKDFYAFLQHLVEVCVAPMLRPSNVAMTA
jgi:hypothetical protein